ncbi:MAG: 4a-hydroxytetrahydrobiopterin dehydratase [Gammaproteobacteria bacterium]|nr:4a-hydroxytetrahydrobiopterin dehydratase [Gammaproteobacteria bacterium]
MPDPGDLSEARTSSSAPLSGSHCTPCRGDIPPLSPQEASVYLEQLPEWELTDHATWIRRMFRFQDFGASFAFVRRVAELAEAEGHHPQITFGWGFCTVALQTMKIRGLHLNDFVLAARVDDLMRAGAP